MLGDGGVRCRSSVFRVGQAAKSRAVKLESWFKLSVNGPG